MTITFGLAYNSIQSNTICEAANAAFGIDRTVSGGIIAALALVIVFGGIHRIAHFSSIVVPIMAIGYLVLALVIIGLNIDKMPAVFELIMSNAFGLTSVAGGGLGATIMMGVKRGLFSNEAGEGSAPNVAATACVPHPVTQGLIQSLAVLTDTLVVCSCTAFIILLSNVDSTQAEGLNGIALTQAALESEVGSSGTIFVAVAIFLFAFSSIIGNYYYGESNIRHLTSSRTAVTAYRVLSAGIFVMLGALWSLNLVWTLGDLCMALLTMCNLAAIIPLGKYAFRLLNDYRQQRKAGVTTPEFHRSQMPDISDRIDCWE